MREHTLQHKQSVERHHAALATYDANALGRAAIATELADWRLPPGVSRSFGVLLEYTLRDFILKWYKGSLLRGRDVVCDDVSEAIRICSDCWISWVLVHTYALIYICMYTISIFDNI